MKFSAHEPQASAWHHTSLQSYFVRVHLYKIIVFFQTYCNKHRSSWKIPVRLGEIVYAKHKNTRYYHAEVVSIEDSICFIVDFEDGSFSDDLPPEDVVVRH